MPRRNRVTNGSRPRMGNQRKVKAVTSNREQTLSCLSQVFKSHECRRHFPTQFFRWESTVYRVVFLRKMSSTSSDSEMNFDSEDSEVYYIAEVETRRGYSKKFYTGRLRPEVQPLTLLYTIFSEKVPLSYTFYWKKAPLSYTFLRRLMNKSLKQEVFLSFFSRSA